MAPVSDPGGPKPGRGGGGGVGGFCRPHWEPGFHRTLLSPPWGPFSPFLFLSVLSSLKWEEGREEVGKIKRPLRKMCKLPMGSRAEMGWVKSRVGY